MCALLQSKYGRVCMAETERLTNRTHIQTLSLITHDFNQDLQRHLLIPTAAVTRAKPCLHPTTNEGLARQGLQPIPSRFT